MSEPVLINNGGKIIFLAEVGLCEAFKRTKNMENAINNATTVLAATKNIQYTTLSLST